VAGGLSCLDVFVWGIVWWVRDIMFREVWSVGTWFVGGM
jgi:hypothetical protein